MRIVTSIALMLPVVVAACDDTCVPPPCLPPFAVELIVTSAATGAPIRMVNLHVAGVVMYDDSCDGIGCIVGGGPGKYEIDISAAGFQSVHRSVVVAGKPAPKCGCESPDTQHISVALTPAPSAVPISGSVISTARSEMMAAARAAETLALNDGPG